MRSILVVGLPEAVEIVTPLIGTELPASLRVVSVDSGREALAAARTACDDDPFDLALLDSRLGDLTWRELTGELSDASPETPLVVCLFPAESNDAGRIERMGHRVLFRPVQEASLSRVVARYVPRDE